MQLIPVISSNISAAGWEANVLRLVFMSGTTVEYQNVSEEWWAQFQAAPSKGGFFANTIRLSPDLYPFRTLPPADATEPCAEPTRSEEALMAAKTRGKPPYERTKPIKSPVRKHDV